MSEWLLIPKRLLTIPRRETTLARRGFSAANTSIRDRLEQVGGAFMDGYHAALSHSGSCLLTAALERADNDLRGFAFEGAAMSLVLQDNLTLAGRGKYFAAFFAGPGNAHAYMLHVGAGWAFARIPWLRWRLHQALGSLDPFFCWLAADGFGFHEGYFHAKSSIVRQRRPVGVSGYARRAFDQGLGRSLWFFSGADSVRIANTIAGFESSRRGDLWSGAGLACAYAGGLDEAQIGELAASSGCYRPEFAQGAAFAAKARQRAGNPAVHTDLACRVACGFSSTDAAALTDDALRDLTPDSGVPLYESWRLRIQREFTGMRK